MTLVLIAQVTFLLQHGQTHRDTDNWIYMVTASVGIKNYCCWILVLYVMQSVKPANTALENDEI